MSTETRIIHKNESEAISRKEDEEDSTNSQAKEPLPEPTLQDSAEQQPEISVHSPDLQRLGTPTSHLQPETVIKTEKFNDSTEGVFETKLQVEDKDSIVLDESIYNTEIQLENKKSFQRENIDPESLEEETQEEMSAHYRRPGYPLDYPGCPGYPEEEKALYFSNTRLEKIRERKYKDWVLGNPLHKELLMDLYVPRGSGIEHPGLPVPQSISCYEMEHLSIFLATEEMCQQYNSYLSSNSGVDIGSIDENEETIEPPSDNSLEIKTETEDSKDTEEEDSTGENENIEQLGPTSNGGQITLPMFQA